MGRLPLLLFITITLFASRFLAAAQQRQFFSALRTSYASSQDTMLNINNSLIIFANNKMCAGCFTQLCESIAADSSLNDLQVIAVSITDRNMLRLRSQKYQLTGIIPCAQQIRFIFADQLLPDSQTRSVVERATPQVMLIRDGNIKHMSFDDVKSRWLTDN
jgi:peroxiredoxin